MKNKSIAELLAAFNDNPNNSEVVDYLTRTNFFDLIGKSRNEMVHSRMIAEILGGRFLEVSSGKTLLHFFDIVMKRAKEQEIQIDSLFQNAVLTRSKRLLDFNLERKDVELPLSKYLTDIKELEEDDDAVINNNDKQKRLDIYLNLTLKNPLKESGRKTVEIFIENKVLSSEHDNQTQVYYDNCTNGSGKGTYQFFIYLSPLSSHEIDHYKEIDKQHKPCAKKDGKSPYIHICYQDILDKVVEPLLVEERLNNRDMILLEEYINCLELASMPDDEPKSSKVSKPTKKELSIMAISNHEKDLIEKFLKNEENKQLLDLVVAHKLKQQLYSYDKNSCLTFNQVLTIALTKYISTKGELQTIKDFENIIQNKNAATPFMIYGKDGADGKLRYIGHKGLYEYKDKVYKTLSKALAQAILDSPNRDNLIMSLKNTKIYGRQRGGKGLLIEEEDGCFSQIDGLNSPLFIRTDIADDKLIGINERLGEDKINPISNDTFCNLLNASKNDFFTENTQSYINIPETNLFFRENTPVEKHEKIIKILSSQSIDINKLTLGPEDETLINQFFINNKKLVISIYRIMLEKETDPEVYKAMNKSFNSLT